MSSFLNLSDPKKQNNIAISKQSWSPMLETNDSELKAIAMSNDERYLELMTVLNRSILTLNVLLQTSTNNTVEQ